MKTPALQRVRCLFWRVMLCAAVSLSTNATATATAAATRVSQFTPQGEALQVQQVRVQFDAPVRPLGEVAGSAPLSFVCQGLGAVTARARWQDERTWAVDFSEMLPAGVRCEFTPVAGMLDMAGQPVSMAAGYRFNTGGPWAREVTVLGWNTQRIDEEAVFVVRAAGEVERSSVEQQVVCVADGIVENIPVKLLSVAEQQKLATRAQRDDLQPDPRLLLLRVACRTGRDYGCTGGRGSAAVRGC